MTNSGVFRWKKLTELVRFAYQHHIFENLTQMEIDSLVDPKTIKKCILLILSWQWQPVLAGYGRGMIKRRTWLNSDYCHLERVTFQKLLKHGSEKRPTWSAVMFWSWFTRVNRPAEPQDDFLSFWLTRSRWVSHTPRSSTEYDAWNMRAWWDIFSSKNKKATRKEGICIRNHTLLKFMKDTCLLF